MENSHFFALLSRMKYIGRWGLMRNSSAENVAEHSLQVAQFAHALAVIKNEYYGGNLSVAEVALCAMYHDAGEIITGDLPTPVKYFNPFIKTEYKKVEALADERLLSMLPEKLRPSFEGAFHADEQTTRLVKAADKLSAYFKCMEELQSGNNEFKTAAKVTRAALDAMHMPEVARFIKIFGGSFDLTLDELQGGRC